MFVFFSFKELKNISLRLRWVFIATCSLSRVAASRGYSLLWGVGLAAPGHMGSSRSRDPIDVLRVGRRIFNQWTTKEV